MYGKCKAIIPYMEHMGNSTEQNSVGVFWNQVFDVVPQLGQMGTFDDVHNHQINK